MLPPITEGRSTSSDQQKIWQSFALDQSTTIPINLGRDEPPELVQLRGLLFELRMILEDHKPSEWLIQTEAIFTRLSEKAAAGDPSLHPTLCHFINTELPQLQDMLRQTKLEPTTSLRSREKIIDQVIGFIEKVSGYFLERLNYSPSLQPVSLVTYEMMGTLSNGRLRVIPNPNGEGKLLQVALGKREESRYVIPIPSGDHVALKGGPPRAILKIIAGAPPRTIKREFPPNDIDAIVNQSSQEAVQEAIRLGADREGIEGVESILSEAIFTGRDISLNSCVLDSKGLRFTKKAYDDAQLGVAVPLHSDRGMFGRNYFRCPDGLLLAQPRCLSRLIKFVAEEKAESFQVHQRNSQIDLGVHILSLARKFASKGNANVLFSRTFELLEQAGQVRAGERNLFDVMARVHSEHPYFDFDGPKLDRLGVAKWLARKLDRFVVRAFRHLEKVALSLDLKPEEGDDRLIKVQLTGEAKPMAPDTHAKALEAFKQECRQRTGEWRANNPNARF
jgi:hypothetical protein